MTKELNDHIACKHWEVITKSQVPSMGVGHVWAMRRKRKIDTREVYKWKARFNVHGGQQQFSMNYWECMPSVYMAKNALLFCTGVDLGWHS